MKQKLLYTAAVLAAVLFVGCGKEESTQAESPHEMNRLTSGIFQAGKAKNYTGAARQIEKLKVHLPNDVRLSKLYRVEMDNIAIEKAQKQLDLGNIQAAIDEITAAVRSRGESLALDAAAKELQALLEIDETVKAVDKAQGAEDFKFQLDRIDKLIKKYPLASSLNTGLAQRRKLQKEMARREKIMAQFDLLSDLVSQPAREIPMLKAQFEYENQNKQVEMPRNLLK